MIAFVIRFIKRFIVLVPGLAVAYFAIKGVFPFFDKRLPDDALAIFVTYVLAAYVMIPAVLRVLRIFIKPKHIPLYSTTPDGFACDPINIGIVGTRKQLIQAMTKAGWYQADRRTFRNLFREGISFLLKRPYPTAPFSSLYLFGRRQDLGFQLPLANPRHRHHVRFWATTVTDDPKQSANILFWQKHQLVGASENILWVGCASLDVGLALIRHNAQVTHMVAPDTNAERDLIVKQLSETGLVKRRRSVKIGAPYQLRNRAINGYLKTDGKMTICEL